MISFTATFVVAWIVSGMIQEYMVNTGKQITRALSKQSVLALLTESGENAESALQQIQGFPEVIAAEIILPDGRVLIGSGFGNLQITSNELANIEGPTLIRNTKMDWLFVAPVRVEPEESEEPEFALNEESSQVIGFSAVKLTKEVLFEANRLVLRYSFGVGLLAAIIFSFILNFGLSRLTRPLMRLSKVMQQAEKSGDHVYAQVEGAREVQRIATTYNRMMEVLDAQDDELRKHRDQLEVEVNLRTRELVEARDSALTASRHKSEFLANMSHELRTPIQAIMGYVDLVKEDLELDGQIHLVDDLERVTRNSRRLLYLINSILDFAKIEAGKMDVNRYRITMGEVVRNVSDVIQPLLKKNKNELTLSGTDLSTEMDTDSEKLEQILVNLLSNACKFTENGQIIFASWIEGNFAMFSVKDTGIGIEDSQLKDIFDEFQQVDGSQSRKFQGTGLGLAIAKRFCQLLGGEITVTSELGQGSEFIVEIPIKMPAVKSEGRSSSSTTEIPD